MNVVLLTLTYPPEPAEHIHDLARYLVGQKHRVTVLTSLPSYPFGRVYRPHRGRLWSRETVDGVEVLRLPIIPSHSKSYLARAVYYLCNSLTISVYLIVTRGRYDVTLAYHPPLTMAIPALLLKYMRKVPFVYWIQDMWPETIEAHSGVNRLTRWIGRLARLVYRSADHLVVLSHGYRKNLIEKGVPAEKVTVVQNWADPAFFSPVEVGEADYRKYGLSGNDFHVFYAGNLGPMQSLRHLVAAAGRLRHRDKVKVVLMGTGVEADELVALTREHNLTGKVLFLGRVPQEEVSRCYSLADVFIVHIKDIPLNEVTIPHKIYGYLLASRPVIAAINGEARDEVVAFGAGLGCRPEDADSIAQAIEGMYAMPVAERREMGAKGRQFVCSERNVETQAAKLERVLVEAARCS